jgi:hypothetical protein
MGATGNKAASTPQPLPMEAMDAAALDKTSR